MGINMLVTILSVTGACLSAWYLRHAELMPIAWNVLPYVIAAILSLTMKSSLASTVLLGAVIAMLVVDGWLYVETILGTNSPVLMAVSLISTMKLFSAFPLGAGLGYVFFKYQS